MILLFIIIFIVIIHIYLPIPKKTRSIEIVVARYNESLDWLLEYPYNEYPTIIYNKGLNDNFIKADNVKEIINLPNVGKIDHTILYHVISHYHNLDDITVFLPGSIDIFYKKIKSKNIIKNANETNDSIYYCFPGQNIKTLYDFKLDSYKTSHSENKNNLVDNNMLKSFTRPFGKWFKEKFPDKDGDCMGHFGIFAVSKKDILKNPLSYYKNLIKELETSSNPEVGHYFERSWSFIFNMEPHSKKTKILGLF